MAKVKLKPTNPKAKVEPRFFSKEHAERLLADSRSGWELVDQIQAPKQKDATRASKRTNKGGAKGV